MKIFRKLRQNYLNQKKIGSYILYAVGEIILVVVGILIALQINNWNQERSESKIEASYISNLQTDVKKQLEIIDTQLEFENNWSELALGVLARFGQDSTIIIDTASSEDLRDLMSRKTFSKADPTYQDLISTGNIRLIKDESLRTAILTYYLELELNDKIMLNNNSLLVDEMFGLKIVHLAYIGEANQELNDVSNKLLQNPEHKMLLINILTYREKIAVWNAGRMKLLKEKTEDLLKKLVQYSA